MDKKNEVLAKEAFALLGVNSFKELSLAYSKEDQKLMKSNSWDPTNKELITNKIHDILSHIDFLELGESDIDWCLEIMWFWNHHAISWAIFAAKDRELAQMYANHALMFQTEHHPNRITRLLWFLCDSQFEKAKEWVADKSAWDEVEYQTGVSLLEEYEQGKFF